MKTNLSSYIEPITRYLGQWLTVLMLVFGASNYASASHIVGGEIYYNYLGFNNYEIHVVIYRDCFSDGADFDPNLSLGIFNENNNLIQEVTIPVPNSFLLPVESADPCVTAPANICTERAIYIKTLNLPPIVGGYTLAYQRCCRGPAILNLQNPAGTGLTLVAKIPGLETGQHANSSSRFTNYPPLVICNNYELNFDHSATDPDGDVLTYSLYTPNEGASSTAPAPAPPPSPPYNQVLWGAGHSQAVPLGPGSSTTIHPSTGRLLATPLGTGKYVVGIKVEERRNGVLLNSSIRDYLFEIFDCDIELEAILKTQEEQSTFESYCENTITFDNDSYGAGFYEWDFGDPTTTTDVSTQFEPTYTYPAPGNYTAMMVANPGEICSDTAYIDIFIEEFVQPNFTANDSVCFVDNSIDFVGFGSASPTATYDWDFGPNATPNVANTQNVNGINFSTEGVFMVTLFVDNGSCSGDTTLPVVIFGVPVTDFTMADNYECEGQTVTFTNLSTNSVVYNWDFGEPGPNDVSTAFEPTWTYQNDGLYDIQLISGTSGLCMDTIVKSILIYKDLELDFTNNDSLCITDNSFDFYGQFSGPDNTLYTWDFGNFANPTTSTDTNVLGVNFSNPGNHTVTLTGEYLHCSESFTKELFIYSEPIIDFTIQPGGQCAPFYASFINQSFSETPMTFSWDFGNGQSSTLQHPSTVYNDPGVYPVTLNISTDKGCIVDLTLTKDDLVIVREKPTAGFYLSSETIDICPGLVTLFDESENSASRAYLLDDGAGPVKDAPEQFDYNYGTSGTKNIRQIVYNEYGCSDTARQTLLVYPYTVYVPNAFTPNGDQFNNNFLTFVALPTEDWHLQIYNRWGKMVYETYDQDAAWNGMYEGKLVPDGVYTYTIQLTSCGKENRQKRFTGHVSVLK